MQKKLFKYSNLVKKKYKDEYSFNMISQLYLFSLKSKRQKSLLKHYSLNLKQILIDLLFCEIINIKYLTLIKNL